MTMRSEAGQPAAAAPGPARRSYRYLDVITAVFITALLVSNLVASKSADVFGFTIGVGIFVFPISYVIGDILTEVYGYSRSRRVIWLGFGCVGLAGVIFLLCDLAPPSSTFRHQEAFHVILGQSPFVLAASMTSYFAGEFCNSFVMAKMKIWTRGRHLWTRTIGSTIVGEGVDSVLFYPLAFWLLPWLFGATESIWAASAIVAVMVNNYVLKVGVEVVLTPVTYRVVGFLKRAEQEDFYDRDTNFNPFRVRP